MMENYKPIIVNLENLAEDSRTNDYMDWSNEIANYKMKLESLPFSWIVWLVWPFGCGKTTFVNQLKEDWEWRINFEARKYPERQSLWENFILEIATQIGEKDFKKIEKIIDGRQYNAVRTLFSIIKLIPAVQGLWWDAVSEGVNHFFSSVPLTRVYQFQNLLTNILLEKMKEYDTIFIVIEDIDRSWDHWVYFLETLNFFLKSLKLPEGKKVLIIATIGSKEFSENKDSYLKSIDYIHSFPISTFKYEKILNKFIDPRVWYNPIAAFFDYVWKIFRSQFTIRDVKHILREVNVILEQKWIWLYSSDASSYLCVLVGILTAKYLFTDNNGRRISYLELWKENKIITEDFFQSYFFSLHTWKSFLQEDWEGGQVLCNVKLNWYDTIIIKFGHYVDALIVSKNWEDSTTDNKIREFVLSSELLRI